MLKPVQQDDAFLADVAATKLKAAIDDQIAAGHRVADLDTACRTECLAASRERPCK